MACPYGRFASRPYIKLDRYCGFGSQWKCSGIRTQPMSRQFVFRRTHLLRRLSSGQSGIMVIPRGG